MMDSTLLVLLCIAGALLFAAVAFAMGRRQAQPVAVSPGADTRAEALEAALDDMRRSHADLDRRLAAEGEKAARVPELERSLAQARESVDALRDAKAEVERNLAKENASTQQAAKAHDELRSRLATVEQNLRSAADRFDTVREEKAQLEQAHAKAVARLGEKSDLAEALRAELHELRAQFGASESAHSELQAEHRRLQEELSQSMKQADEKLALLRDARKEMEQQFRVLAEDVMKTHGTTFAKQNKEQIDVLLTPLRDKLVEFQTGLQAAHTESAKDRAGLAEQIRTLTESSATMTRETHNLTQALKGKAQTQGAWGEMILTSILERSGLRRGEEYVTQESHTSENGRLRPDVLINLPNSERLVVDSKVSLTAFEAYVNANDEPTRAAYLTRHLTSLRGHIKSLSAKEYQQAAGTGMNFVIMFVPIEGALAVALQHEPGLTAFAAESHVAIATPTTLMMALRTVASLWQVERRNQNAEAIAQRAGKLYDKLVGFVGDLTDVGQRLSQAQKSYGDALSKLSTGRGNLLRQAEDLKDMGAKTAKALPASLVDGSERPALATPAAPQTESPASQADTSTPGGPFDANA